MAGYGSPRKIDFRKPDRMDKNTAGTFATLVIRLPENCLDCPLAKDNSEYMEHCLTCMPLKKGIYFGEYHQRQQWCPLIPVESMEDIVDENKRAETLKKYVWGNIELAKENDKWAEKIGGIFRE